MTRQQLKYDAFISYKHGELDEFVAMNVRRELEKFKLPRALVKKREAGAKTRIERVFRDRDELSIAADLSEEITEALENSEFLIAICSPRFVESMWCRKEIQTFSELHGKDKVLAVLVEGEPDDAFPKEICDGGEPLAADVRGKNKSEIKKKIKIEVDRLAAAIFGCNYDEIKQRHKEQKLKRNTAVALTTAIAGLAFGAIVANFAIKLNDKNDVISNQFEQIKQQYNEKYIKQSQMVTGMAEELLNKGDIEGARELVEDDISECWGDIPDEAKANYRYILAEIMRMYDSGQAMTSRSNLLMKANVDVIEISPDNKYIAAFDVNKNLKIWNIKNSELMYEQSTDVLPGKTNETPYRFTNDGKFIYIGNESVICIDIPSSQARWEIPVESGIKFNFISDDKMLLISKDRLFEIDIQTGRIIQQKDIDKKYKGFYGITIFKKSGDDFLVVLQYANESMLVKINSKSLEITQSLNLGRGSAVTGLKATEDNFVIETFLSDEVGSGTSYLVCIDSNTLKEKWKKKSDKYFNEMYSYNGLILAIYAGGIQTMDSTTFKVNEEFYLARTVLDIATYGKDSKLLLYLSDGSIKFQNNGSLTFYDTENQNIDIGDLKFYKFAGNCSFATRINSNRIVMINKQTSEYASYFKADEEFSFKKDIGFTSKAEGIYAKKDDKSVFIYNGDEEICRFDTPTEYLKGAYKAPDENFIVLQYGDNSVEIIDLRTRETLLKFDLSSRAFVERVNDYYFAIGDANFAYIINKNTFIREAKVYHYAGYNSEKDSFILAKAYTEKEGYEVKFYSFDSLWDMIRK